MKTLGFFGLYRAGLRRGALGGWLALAATVHQWPLLDSQAQQLRAFGTEPLAQKVPALAELNPPARVELFEAFGKTPVLRISYPWKAYRNASLELRFFSLSQVDDERIQPLFFRSRYWKGKLLHTAYDCLLQAADVPVQKSLSAEGLDWLLVADLSLLGRPALWILREIPADPRLRSQSATAVIYPLLDHWAEDDYHLCLELPGRFYPQPAQLRVWFLRDNRVLWTQKVCWPGLKAAGSSSVAPPSQ